jgi:predicted pyridoxine 5'-phosphate oxidase superfamily flavin-nucleotide-binding protein
MDQQPTFHPGELALQLRAGSFARLAEVGPRVIRDHMPDQHREFFALLPFLLAGSLDADGQPWASVLAGPQGFAHAPDPRRLRIDALPLPHDPLRARLHEGMPIGLLGIQPHTRRRNRMNGAVTALDGQGFTVQVAQSFGNCPKYIQPREPQFWPAGAAAPSVQRLHALDAQAIALIGRADTFFIATAHPQSAGTGQPAFGVDVSHRGGPPGFVRVEADGRLAVPDFVGNGFFNTLGNLQLEPRCGLLFMDFGTGELLHLAARAELQWDGPQVQAVEGAQRLLRLAPTQALRLAGGLPLRWNPV